MYCSGGKSLSILSCVCLCHSCTSRRVVVLCIVSRQSFSHTTTIAKHFRQSVRRNGKDTIVSQSVVRSSHGIFVGGRKTPHKKYSFESFFFRFRFRSCRWKSYHTMSSLADIVPPGVVTGDNLLKLFEYARKNNFAIPAFNCTRYVWMHASMHPCWFVGG